MGLEGGRSGRPASISRIGTRGARRRMITMQFAIRFAIRDFAASHS
jgi:hypothetical protein